jgi:hypothetical protein
MRPEEDDKPEHENRQPHGPSLAKITIDVCAACCPAGAVEAMACREARSSASHRHCTAGDGTRLVNCAPAIIASAMITGSSRFPPARGQAMRTMNIKEGEKIQ